MSKSLSIASGDLSVTGRHYDTVSGKDKLMQDLRCALIEQIGDDPATPNFGSQFELILPRSGLYRDALRISPIRGHVDPPDLPSQPATKDPD
jgi:hypothetical protein